ncbi:hypothetical protein J5751_00575 [bacterium]|nr:hypothetical protein [bacterium]
MAEGNECLSTDQFNEISETYENLKAESNETLNESLPGYIEQAYKFETLVQDDTCEK